MLMIQSAILALLLVLLVIMQMTKNIHVSLAKILAKNVKDLMLKTAPNAKQQECTYISIYRCVSNNA